MLKWIAGLILIAGVLLATDYVVDLNQAAMTGTEGAKPFEFSH